MRGRDFLDKMELVSPIYVEGADRTPIIRPKQWPKFVVAAACLCLMVWGAWSFTGGFGREPGYVAGPGESQGLERASIEVDGMTLEPCPGTLGFDECWVRRSGEPDAAIWLYYTRRENGQYRLVAESWWNAKSAAPYEADLDGDGVKELIFNLNYEDGFREIQIIRHRDGEIQNWYFNNEFLRDHWEEQGLTVLDGATEHIRSYYDPNRGIVLEADCYDSTGKEVLSVEVFQDLEHFKYFIDERHTYADEIGEPTPQPTENHDDVASIAPEPCPATLGFENCVMTWEELPTGVTTWRFYAVEDGQYLPIARTGNYGYEPDVYRVDLDGDGVDELVCNREWAGGDQDVIVYRNKNGQIEQGWLDLDVDNWLDICAKEGLSVRYGSEDIICSHYDPEQGFVLNAHPVDKNGEDVFKIATFQGLEYFAFEPYDPAVIPLGVATVKAEPEPCPATLGFENCIVTWKESSTWGTTIWRFYAQGDGQYQLIADARNLGDEPDVYRVDLDGDGVDELICNQEFADGNRDVIVYRNRDGRIEQGWLNTVKINDQIEAWAGEGLDMTYAVGAVAIYYDPAQGFVLNSHFRDKNGEDVLKTATFQGLEHFLFGGYVPAVYDEEDPVAFW